jgi:hypothetical protein
MKDKCSLLQVDGGKGRKALATVVTTLMLLVASILISGVAIYYATNLVSTRLQFEEVRLAKIDVWVNSTGAVAALKVQNLGGKDILIDKLEVRGVEEAWSTVYYYRIPEDTIITGSMNATSYARLTGASVTIDTRSYIQATDDIPLGSGREILMYIKGPDSVQLDDIGTTVSISLETSNSKYITECNVKFTT